MMRSLAVALAVIGLAANPVMADLSNPGFEIGAEQLGPTGITYWAWDVPPAWTHGGSWGDRNAQSWRSHSGTNEATLRDWGQANNDCGWWQEVTNNLGDLSVWTAGGWFANDNGGWGGGVYTNVRSELKIEFYSGAFGPALGVATNAFPLPGETWTYVSLVATAPVNTAWARFVAAAIG